MTRDGLTLPETEQTRSELLMFLQSDNYYLLQSISIRRSSPLNNLAPHLTACSREGQQRQSWAINIGGVQSLPEKKVWPINIKEEGQFDRGNYDLLVTGPRLYGACAASLVRCSGNSGDGGQVIWAR